jgi:hypothetical protein
MKLNYKFYRNQYKDILHAKRLKYVHAFQKNKDKLSTIKQTYNSDMVKNLLI